MRCGTLLDFLKNSILRSWDSLAGPSPPELGIVLVYPPSWHKVRLRPFASDIIGPRLSAAHSTFDRNMADERGWRDAALWALLQRNCQLAVADSNTSSSDRPVDVPVQPAQLARERLQARGLLVAMHALSPRATDGALALFDDALQSATRAGPSPTRACWAASCTASSRGTMGGASSESAPLQQSWEARPRGRIAQRITWSSSAASVYRVSLRRRSRSRVAMNPERMRERCTFWTRKKFRTSHAIVARSSLQLATKFTVNTSSPLDWPLRRTWRHLQRSATNTLSRC
jgi:hypothetical protein